MAATTQVTKDFTPAQIDLTVNEYMETLKATGLTYNETRIRDDIKKRVADMNSMTVADWEAKWAGTPPPAEPKAEKPKAPVKPEDRIKKAKERASSVDGTYFWMSEEDRSIADTWMKLRLDAGIVQHMMVTGPSGSGKTEGLKRIAQEHGMPAYKVDCASITTTDKWLGMKNIEVVDGKNVTTFTLSEHLKWLGAIDCQPGLVIYDELTRLHPSLLNILIPILDGSEEIWVPDLGIYARVHEKTIIAATANIGAQFAGTYGLDAALHDRFSVISERKWPPTAEEMIILERRTGIETGQAKQLVEIAQGARAKFDQQLISRPVSTRNLIDAGFWVYAGMSVMKACDTTFLKKYSTEGGASSERTVVQLVVQGKAGA